MDNKSILYYYQVPCLFFADKLLVLLFIYRYSCQYLLVKNFI